MPSSPPNWIWVGLSPLTFERGTSEILHFVVHFEYLVMLFVLCNAPAVFQQFVNNFIYDLLYCLCGGLCRWNTVFSPEDHIRDTSTFCTTLNCMHENHLYAKLEKCLWSVFLKTPVCPVLGTGFLNLVCWWTQRSNPLNWPCPKGLHTLWGFIGCANFATLVVPIAALTMNNPKGMKPQAK